ncbi:hypothetical protein ETB97_000704 [Aspergillus alliaceus]|uniref:Uncharacterized protein n=1 Tax=Petromyces alliaceus TaxID=209559 RepID=A0A8H6AFH4_PETAA|nr:hypothetical protein ETB97_000704 [Aspergillus burnettii]
MSDPFHLVSLNRFHRRVSLDTQYCRPAHYHFLRHWLLNRYDAIIPVGNVRLALLRNPVAYACRKSRCAPARRRSPIPKFSRVNLVSHGAGTIYLLNIKARCRDVGKPNPVLTFLAPGVDPTHSRVTAIQMAQYVTTKAFAAWYHIPRFFVLQASPALQCLRKDDVSSWGGCSEYAACAKMLAAGEASREG